MLPKFPVTRRAFVAGAVSTLAAPALAQESRPVWTLPEEYFPREVRLGTDLPPGQLHVEPNVFSIYWTLPKSRALKFTVGVGRGGLYEPGSFFVGAKKEWPSWTPTKEMIEREPEHYAQYEDGMPGGPSNPLGARALYLFTAERGDTFLRVHGTPQPWTIGSAVSNGCVRLINDHITLLYDMVPMGAPVILHPKRA